MSGGAFDASLGTVFVLIIVKVKDSLRDVSGYASLTESVKV
jgi:hypothetical protein